MRTHRIALFHGIIRKGRLLLFATALFLSEAVVLSHAAPLKPRILVLTDISTWEPDDHESLTRLLVHADLFEIEGLVFTTGWSIDDAAKHAHFTNIIHGVIDAYEQDLPNLLKRSNQTGHAHDSHQWIRREFADDLLFIWDECVWKYQNGTGRANWSEYETHIQNHGTLGRQYPKYKYGVEGDTPAFLHILPNGLNNPEIPSQTGWGGYSERGLGPDKKTRAFTNHEGAAHAACEKYARKFYPATFNNFSARMDWAKDGAGNRNPLVVIDGNEGIAMLTRTPRLGTEVRIDASASFDPDGDALTFAWWIQPEAGTYSDRVDLSDDDKSAVTVHVPADSAGKTFHLICEVTDGGAPNLTSYRRIIFAPRR